MGEMGEVLVGGGEGEDDIENLKRSERFRSKDVIEIKKIMLVHNRGILEMLWYGVDDSKEVFCSRMDIEWI
ncbi:hypothetical protein Tco_1007065 [Tanacetum coccineum]|uniref:Uncharacterized protein n=1 Tax=Tanacetum coccineum TaxID=301880 RepID=A0ABQ5FM03_9ASTR